MRRSTILAALLLACCGPVTAPPTCAPEDIDGFEDDDGCADADNDRDGVADAADACPCHAEDVDGFEDEDGCPDPDNDGDERVDACDLCPDEPETINGLDDLDGCPDDARIRVRDRQVQIIPRVHFRRGSAHIEPAHHALLDEIASAMSDHPRLEQVEVQGHATPDEPPNLAQQRAEAVREALIERGIDRARLVARSYGAHQPMAPDTPEGRARNRRVELAILRLAEPPAALAPRDPCPDGPPPVAEGVCANVSSGSGASARSGRPAPRGAARRAG